MRNKILERKKYLRKIPAIIVMIGIFVLSGLPGNDPFLNTFHFSDKIKHFIAYFTLGIGFSMWISRLSWRKKPIIWGVIVCLLCLAFGITDEFHQSFIPNRSGNDLGDLAADFIGGLVAPIVYFIFLITLLRAPKQ